MQSVLAPTANPEAPNEVNVSQPSDVLTSRAVAAGAFDSLLLGLGVVALIVGAVGVANIMVISVLRTPHCRGHPDRRVRRHEAGRSSVPTAAYRGIANGMSGPTQRPDSACGSRSAGDRLRQNGDSPR